MLAQGADSAHMMAGNRGHLVQPAASYYHAVLCTLRSARCALRSAVPSTPAQPDGLPLLLLC